MLKAFLGFLFAVFPLAAIGVFCSRIFFFVFHGAEAYSIGLLCLLGTLVSSLLCPVPFGIWWIGWRSKLAACFLILSLFAAAVSLSILYFDPGHRIAAFMAD